MNRIENVTNDKKRKTSSWSIESNTKENRIQRMISRLQTDFYRRGAIIDYISQPIYLNRLEIDLKIQELNNKGVAVYLNINNFPEILPQRRRDKDVGNIVLKEKRIRLTIYNCVELAVRQTTELIDNLNSDHTYFKNHVYPTFLDKYGDINECQNCTEYTAHARCDICKSAFCVFCLSKYIKRIYRDRDMFYSLKNICQCHLNSKFRVHSYASIKRDHENVKQWETNDFDEALVYFDDLLD